MSRSSSKTDLLHIIDTQKEQLQRYEGRLRDVVKAYKGLCREKEALQASLAAICATSSNKDRSNAEPAPEEAEASGDPGTSDFVDPLQANVSSEQDAVSSLKERVQTLTTALSTLTESKTKMEGDYQADKKQQMQQHESSSRELKKVISDSNDTIKRLEEELKQVKSLMRNEEYEHEKQLSALASKVKDAQHTLAKERASRESAEKQAEKLEKTLQQHLADSAQSDRDKKQRSARCEEHEVKIKDLEDNVIRLSSELKAADFKAQRKGFELEQVRAQLEAVKQENKKALQAERLKSHAIEEVSKSSLGEKEELRLALEARVSELSSVIGGYEKTVQENESLVKQLKSKIKQLENERPCYPQPLSDETDDAKLQLLDSYEQVASNQLSLARDILVKAQGNTAISEPLHVVAMLRDWGLISEEEENQLHTTCREEVQRVRNELAAVKVKSRALSPVGKTNEKLIRDLNWELSNLKDKLQASECAFNEEQMKQNQMIADLHEQLSEVKLKWKEEMLASEIDFKQKLAEVTHQMQRQRERTINLISEKDKEIESLQRQLCALSEQASKNKREGGRGSTSIMGDLDANASKTDGHNTMLHYEEELARYEIETGNMRKGKLQLETALRELQMISSTKEERYTDQIDLLKEEIRKLERNQSRESANLEYLKNVIISWIDCQDVESKAKMMNAIATILEFSPRERERVVQGHHGWWKSK